MELVGHEKRIQELFRELRLEDERITPRFVAVWNRVESAGPEPNSAFRVAFAVAAVLLVCALFSLAWWSKRWQRPEQSNELVAVGTPKTDSSPTPTAKNPEPKPDASAEPRHRVSFNLRARRLAARRHAELLARDAVIREARAIASWQSPTITLLRSPADEVLTSLPQLNQTVNELKSFLPNTPN
jgi:hypothetical protein